MENEPDADVETYFNNGVKITYTDKTVKLTDTQAHYHLIHSHYIFDI